ncbi:FAD/NAD(P)-binding domain-containing protein [Mycena vulgaris]|nr:FAD/NAD(P)-binding domain-containing protein [Mycena vulgaris]KAJ6560899.1 FAD/NAD(P)-binding domain-containing protein [Mycena vulgaris]
MAPLETSNVELQPLKISIVGAGLAGLAAAIALRRNGHIVQIFESAKVTSEIGAAIAVPVNSQRVLERFGYSRENLKSVPFDATVYFDSKGGEGTTNSWLIPLEKQNLLCHRSDLHAELERLAVGPGEGPPAVLHVASQVVGCDTEQGSLTLKDGQVIHGDVVLGADGISSTIRTHVLGYLQKSLGSGCSCYRAVLDTSKLPGPPALGWLRDGASGLRMVPLRGSPFRMLSMYPCRSGTLLNFVAIYEDPNQDDPAWSAVGTREEVQEAFAQFHEQFQPVLAALPDRLGKWQLRTLPVLPTRRRACDDAVAGPGRCDGAVEDAAALGALLPAGTARADVPARLAAYEALRKPRGEWVGRESLEQAVVPKQRGAYSRSKEMQQYMMEYDAVKTAEEYYQERFGAGTIGE